MYAVQPFLLDTISRLSRCLQTDVERMAERFSLKLESISPALELHAHIHFLQVQLEYTLWGDEGVVTIKGRPHFTDEEVKAETTDEIPLTFPLTMRFALSYDPTMDVELKKMRIEEMFYGNGVELIWNIAPGGYVGHLELTLNFAYRMESGLLCEYAGFVLGMITGTGMAA